LGEKCIGLKTKKQAEKRENQSHTKRINQTIQMFHGFSQSNKIPAINKDDRNLRQEPSQIFVNLWKNGRPAARARYSVG
jgi:hypothetical protein